MSWLLCRWDNHIEQSLEMPIKIHLPCWGKQDAKTLNVFIWPTWCHWNWLHDWWWRNQGVSGLFERSLRPSPLRWLLPNVLRHIRPRSICIIGGVFLFLLVVCMDVLIALVQFAGCLILIALCLGLFIMTLIMFCVITGSSVDPDDNGLLKTKAQKEAWRKEKLEKHKIDLWGGVWT